MVRAALTTADTRLLVRTNIPSGASGCVDRPTFTIPPERLTRHVVTLCAANPSVEELQPGNFAAPASFSAAPLSIGYPLVGRPRDVGVRFRIQLRLPSTGKQFLMAPRLLAIRKIGRVERDIGAGDGGFR